MFASYRLYSDSSAKIKHLLKIPDNTPNTSSDTEFTSLSVYSDVYTLVLPKAIQKSIAEFKHKLAGHKGVAFSFADLAIADDGDYLENQSFSLKKMKAQFEQVEQLLDYINKLSETDSTFFKESEKDTLICALEKYKLALMSAVWQHMQQHYQLRKAEREAKTTESVHYKKLLHAVYTAVSYGGYLATIADGLLAALTMFAGLANVFLIPITALAAYINIKLYKSVELTSLKHEFGLSDTHEVDEMLKVKQDQVSITKKINMGLMASDTTIMQQHCFVGYAGFAKVIHKSIENQNKKIAEYQEPLVNRAKRYLLGGSGAAIMGAFGYFSIQEAALAVAVLGLAATPPGWVVVGLSVITAACVGVAYLFAVQGMGLFSLFNPRASSIKQTKDAYKEYETEFGYFERDINFKMTASKQHAAEQAELHQLRQQQLLQNAVTQSRKDDMETLSRPPVLQRSKSFSR